MYLSSTRHSQANAHFKPGKEHQAKAREERLRNREANRNAVEEKTLADAETEVSLKEIGLVEFPEASQYWKTLEEKSASCEDYQQQYEASKKKIVKMKVRMEGLTAQLALYTAGMQKLQEEKKELAEQLEGVEERLQIEVDKKMRYEDVSRQEKGW